jgi:hypothetical protein
MTANKNAITTRAIVVVSKSNELMPLLAGVEVDVGV